MSQGLVAVTSIEVTDRMGENAAKLGGGARVSKQDIESEIAYVFYTDGSAAARSGHGEAMQSLGFQDAYDRLQWLTLCIIVMKNGFSVIGTSAPMSPRNYDPQVGKLNAYENAFRQLWPLMAYARLDRGL